MQPALVSFFLIPPSLLSQLTLSVSHSHFLPAILWALIHVPVRAQCLPEERTRIRAPQSLLTSDLGLLLPVSSTVANMLYKYCTALQAVCVLQVWRAGEEGRKRGSYLIPPKGTPLSTRIVNSQANCVAGRHTTHTLLSF